MQLPKEALQVVLLGPGQDQQRDYEKRVHIRDSLRKQGYVNARLGEETIDTGTSLPLNLALRERLPHIDLLLVLDTGPAPLAELSAIYDNYRARQITKAWYKREFVAGRHTTPMDVVNGFDNWPFSEDEFVSCDLTAEFISMADRFCLNKAQLEGRLSGLGLLPPS